MFLKMRTYNFDCKFGFRDLFSTQICKQKFVKLYNKRFALNAKTSPLECVILQYSERKNKNLPFSCNNVITFDRKYLFTMTTAFIRVCLIENLILKQFNYEYEF